MNAPSHTLLSVLKRTAARHHGATATVGTAPRRRHEHRTGGSESPAGQGRGLLLFVLLIAQLMVILDITAVNVALPDMAAGLGISGGDIGWTITSYSLVFGSRLPCALQ